MGAGQVVTVSTFNQFSHVSFLSNLQRIDFCLPTTPGAIKANQRIDEDFLIEDSFSLAPV